MQLLSLSADEGRRRADDPYGPRRLPRGSRLLVLTAGPCTKGPGSLHPSSLEAGAGFHERLGGALTKEQRQQATTAQEFMAGCVDLAKALAVPVDLILGKLLQSIACSLGCVLATAVLATR